MREKIMAVGMTALAAGLMTTGFTLLSATPQVGADTVETAENTEALSVLGYTRVGHGAGAIQPEEFIHHLNYLEKNGYTIISPERFLDWKAHKTELPPRSALITIDTATPELLMVLPSLQQRGFPFVVFADAADMNGALGELSFNQLEEVHRAGGTIGCITAIRGAAQAPTGMTGTEALDSLIRHELSSPDCKLADKFDNGLVLSTPGGCTDYTITRTITTANCKLAFTQQTGKAHRDESPFFIHRFPVTGALDFARALACSQEEQATILRELNNDGEATEEAPAPAVTTIPAIIPIPAPQEPVDTAPAQTVITQIPQPAPQPADTPALAETVTKPTQEPVAEEEAAQEDPLYPAVKAEYGQLGRRSPEGDWVTSRFTSPLVPREQTRVAVLGYHNFSNTKSITDMRMRTADFCQQMQYIRNAGLSVITMQDFLEWRFGQRMLPERCVLITIDDGWRSVYTDAYPVLKAYGYPFTLFLYTRYLSGAGASMSPQMIKEMMACGATVGSHSTNHLYPKSWKRYGQDSDAYATQMQKELADSRTKLLELFGNCSTYCYPGGYNTAPMHNKLAEAGYAAAFTVLPAKVQSEEVPYQVHRYMILGNQPFVFRQAVNFDGQEAAAYVKQAVEDARPVAYSFFPKAFEGLPENQLPGYEELVPPAEEADLAIDPDEEEAAAETTEPAPATVPAPETTVSENGQYLPGVPVP